MQKQKPWGKKNLNNYSNQSEIDLPVLVAQSGL